jgi:hypothetical protein
MNASKIGEDVVTGRYKQETEKELTTEYHSIVITALNSRCVVTAHGVSPQFTQKRFCVGAQTVGMLAA